jgi:hypothetical protein
MKKTKSPITVFTCSDETFEIYKDGPSGVYTLFADNDEAPNKFDQFRIGTDDNLDELAELIFDIITDRDKKRKKNDRYQNL